VIDLIEDRAPDGFNRIEDVASHEELKAIVGGYAQAAGFSRPQDRVDAAVRQDPQFP
jgi:hypothetical protein